MRRSGLPLGSIPFRKYSGTEKSPEQFFRLLQEEGTGNREQGTGNREQGTGNREQGRRKILLCLSFKEALSGQLSAFPRTVAQTAFSRFFFERLWFAFG
ncbi:MAG: hypothetical protein F6K24_01105 [Okeania sp. SIO2D1]|nr:hypothetical protein [Okeania sp. SIO2D1]